MRPTKAELTPDKARLSTGSQLARLYGLIWSRAVASQMAAAKMLQVHISFSRAEQRFNVDVLYIPSLHPFGQERLLHPFAA